jgi:hypothetical protein
MDKIRKVIREEVRSLLKEESVFQAAEKLYRKVFEALKRRIDREVMRRVTDARASGSGRAHGGHLVAIFEGYDRSDFQTTVYVHFAMVKGVTEISAEVKKPSGKFSREFEVAHSKDVNSVLDKLVVFIENAFS